MIRIQSLRVALVFVAFMALVSVFVACEGERIRGEIEIPDFNFPQTVEFAQNLSTYAIFQGNPANLQPADDYHLLELSSILYTDQAKKQRLVKVPAGTSMDRLSDGSIDFPDGTVLVKTFYYYFDERDTSLGKRIIESRLLIKEDNLWNVATYLWNEEQTDATLTLNGLDTNVSWIDADGNSLSTLYHVPDENECIACHQANSATIPLGTTLRNLNRTVDRNGNKPNQITYLQGLGVVRDFPLSQVDQIIDYSDPSYTLADRSRAYLDLNCAHCHNPYAWEKPTERQFDFRYETPFDETGINREEDRITDALLEMEMPFIGVTLLDQEGVNLLVDYLESL